MDVEDIGSGPPVLAIHGLGGGAYFFRSIAERLRHDYRIISVDLPTTPGCSMAITPVPFPSSGLKLTVWFGWITRFGESCGRR